MGLLTKKKTISQDKVRIPEVKESNVLIVLGNGFNLALGLRTSYRAFAEKFLTTEAFCGESELGKALAASYNGNPKNWCDLEADIKKFALSFDPAQLDSKKEMAFYDLLVQRMGIYMDGEAKFQFLCQHIERSDEFDESLPVNMLREILNQDRHYHVISFNYTDMDLFLPEIASRIIFMEDVEEDVKKSREVHDYIRERIDVDYVHISGERCVLGIDDDERIPQALAFLKKCYQFTRSPHYPERVNDYKSIIVYGHSMGEADSDFLHIMFDGVMGKTIEQNPHLFFVTRDLTDQQAILSNITRLLKTSLSCFQRHIAYDFIYDDSSSSSKTMLLSALMSGS